LSYTVQQAYDAIKTLEAQGKLVVPLGTQAVRVGSFDAASSQFTFAVPTFTDTQTIYPGLNPVTHKPLPPIVINYTIGSIVVNSVNLALVFDVAHSNTTFTVSADGMTVSVPFQPPVKTAGAALAPRRIVLQNPFAQRATLNLGPYASLPVADFQYRYLRVDMQCGSAQTTILLQVVRLPAATAGAFTMPVLPIALVYAPPPGPQNKNFAEYTSMSASSRKVSSTFTSSTMDKSADAYTTVDYLGKVGGIVSNVQSLITAFKQIAMVSQIGAEIALGLNLLSGFLSSTTTTTSSTLTTTSEHDLQTTDTLTETFGTPVGLGPGHGDRFVFLRNVRIAWLIAANQLIFTVLGDDGIAAFVADQLISDLQAILSSSGAITAGPDTNLDADSLQMLLSLDPFVGNPTPSLPAPRFLPADPPSFLGAGSDPNGDTIAVSHEITTTDTATTNSVQATITDTKPGWLNSLFGFDTDQSTERQTTLGYTTAEQNSTDNKQTIQVKFFAGPTDPPTGARFFFDTLFGTFAFLPLDPNAPLA
jgi:hypothetical protein